MDIVLFPEAAILLVNDGERDLCPHSGRTTKHARDLSSSGILFRSLPVTLPVTFPRCSAQSNSWTSTRYGTNCA